MKGCPKRDDLEGDWENCWREAAIMAEVKPASETRAWQCLQTSSRSRSEGSKGCAAGWAVAESQPQKERATATSSGSLNCWSAEGERADAAAGMAWRSGERVGMEGRREEGEARKRWKRQARTGLSRESLGRQRSGKEERREAQRVARREESWEGREGKSTDGGESGVAEGVVDKITLEVEKREKGDSKEEGAELANQGQWE